MPDKKLLKQKLEDIQSYYEELMPFLKHDTSVIVHNKAKLRNVERLFQLIVDTSLDINSHIISEMNIQIPDDYQSTFITLGENDILPMDFALRISPSVGLRNRVIHKYGKVNLSLMIEHIKKGIDDYVKYMQFINKFLEKQV